MKQWRVQTVFYIVLHLPLQVTPTTAPLANTHHPAVTIIQFVYILPDNAIISKMYMTVEFLCKTTYIY